jgi:outer membrane protein assembly factor BamB
MVNRGILLMACAAATGWCSWGGDWPHWRGPDWNGITAETVPSTWPDGPKVLWRASVGTGFSSISISRGRAYTMGNTNEQETVWCLNALTGAPVWHHTYKARLDPQWYEGGPNSTATVDENRVYTLSKWGNIFCLDAGTGRVVWERDLGREGVRSNRWGFAGSPRVYGKLLLLNAGTTGMALDRETGRTVWSTGTNVTGYASPVLYRDKGEDRLLIFGAKNLVCLRPGDGREFWRYPFETGYDVNNTDPMLCGGKVFITSYSRGCALLDVSAGSPEPVYTNRNLSVHLGPGILLGEHLYSFNGEAHANTDFRCLHVPTGYVNWTRKDLRFGCLICAAGKLLILLEKGELLVAEPSPAELKVLARAQILEGVCWTPPTLANGLFYARTAKGAVVCLDFRPTSQAPRPGS